MRVGIDASNLVKGGGVTHLVELLRAADPEMHGFRRVMVWAGSATLQQLPDRPWLEKAHDSMLDGSLPMRAYWQCRRLASHAARRCDVLFAPGGHLLGEFQPFVTMFRNMLIFSSSEVRRYGVSIPRCRLGLLKWAQTRSFRRADGVIFLTPHARDVIEASIGPLGNRQGVIPHGLNGAFRQEPRLMQPIQAYAKTRPFRWIYVSHIAPYKHQWCVVEAVTALRREGWPVALDLIGGTYADASQRLLHRTVTRVDPENEFVRLHGEVPYPQLPQYYHQADGAVFASSCENLPNILLESMASGLPLACSNRRPMPDILGNGGVYFDPERPEEIADACRTLMEDAGLREKLAWEAYEKAREYTWERCAAQTFAFLKQIAWGYAE